MCVGLGFHDSVVWVYMIYGITAARVSMIYGIRGTRVYMVYGQQQPPLRGRAAPAAAAAGECPAGAREQSGPPQFPAPLNDRLPRYAAEMTADPLVTGVAAGPVPIRVAHEHGRQGDSADGHTAAGDGTQPCECQRRVTRPRHREGSLTWNGCLGQYSEPGWAGDRQGRP